MNEDDMIIRMDMKRIAREKKTEDNAEIERLRNECSNLTEIALEAGKKIERLNRKIAEMYTAMEGWRGALAYRDAEIGQLRTLKTPASRELLDITKGCLDAAEAEVERLRAALGPSATEAWAHMYDETVRLQAEVERLQAELGQVREILNDREAEIERMRNERKNCPPASESEYVRRLEDEVKRMRALALKFLFEQTEANADALRAACEVRQ